MADEETSAEEFRVFIRDLGVRAFDQLASGFGAASEAVGRRAQSMSKLAGTWSKMPPSEKETFFDQLIDAARSVAAAAPGLIGLGRSSRSKASSSSERTSGDAPAKKKATKKTPTRKKRKT